MMIETVEKVEIEQNRHFNVISDESQAETSGSDIKIRVSPSSIAASSTFRDRMITLRSKIIGNYYKFYGPFGPKPVCYVDWTASGRSIKPIEEYLVSNILPLYGNTHTTTSRTGHQSTCYRQEARQIVAQAVNARITGRAAEDVVIFTGHGTTSAINKIVLSMGINIPYDYRTADDRPIVFTSSYEHHSNLLPWRESVAEVVTVAYSMITGVCLQDLARLLLKHVTRRVKIGTFSAASNVTGVLTDVDAVATLMHQNGGLAIFDYATAAPYVKMDMNPLSSLAYKDAIVFSGHKLLGGPGSTGVLIAKRRLLTPVTAAPTEPGGGTVFYVTEAHHRYLANREEREEGGTPDLIADVRLGLALHLKQTAGVEDLEADEMRIAQTVWAKLSVDKRIVLLGRPQAAEHWLGMRRYLPIFSFLIRCGSRVLHHNYICALLNDLFGVQARGGCMCAGPFSQALLGISAQANAQLEAALLDKHEVLRPGYIRLSLPAWMGPEEVDFVVAAVMFVAEHGPRFLSLYRYNHKTGEWAHHSHLTRFPERRWLSGLNFFADSAPAYPCAKDLDNRQQLILTTTESLPSSYSMPIETLVESLRTWGVSSLTELLDEVTAAASKELAKLGSTLTRGDVPSGGSLGGVDGLEHLRWFAIAADLNSIPGATPEISALTGVIQPNLFIDSLNSCNAEQSTHSSTNVSESSAHMDLHPTPDIVPSAYVLKREKKLPAIVVDSGKLRLDSTPRYAQVEFIGSLISKAPTTFNATTNPSSAPHLSPSNATTPYPLPHIDANSTTALRLVSEPLKLNGTGVTYSPSSTNPQHYFSFHMAPPKKIMKLVGQAVKEWDMIQDGDRLLLGLSGGKDSLALLHILLALQKRAPISFEIGCATVDPQTSSFDPRPLIPYMQSLGVTYHYLSEPIVEMARSKLQGDSLCAFCSRFKRGLLYSCCRIHKYNKLVLAQHLDDLAESFMMSALHNGQIRTMKANYTIEAGDVRVIRPLVYVREHSTRDFSLQSRLPIINENCPACFEQPKERDRVKKLLSQEESMVPALFFNLRKAFMPLLHDDTYAAMQAVTLIAEDRGRSQQGRHEASSKKKLSETVDAQDKSETKKIKKYDENNAPECTRLAVVCSADRSILPECSSSGYCAPCYELA